MTAVLQPAIAASQTFGGPLPVWAAGALTIGVVMLAAAMVAYAASAGRRRAREEP